MAGLVSLGIGTLSYGTNIPADINDPRVKAKLQFLKRCILFGEVSLLRAAILYARNRRTQSSVVSMLHGVQVLP